MNETGNSFITIDLAKIKSNMEKIRNHVGPDVEIMPVLKANACGHGLIRTSDWLVKECGIKRLAVAQVREAEQLRRAGSQAEIMVLGGVPVNNALCGSGESHSARLPHPGCRFAVRSRSGKRKDCPCPYKN